MITGESLQDSNIKLSIGDTRIIIINNQYALLLYNLITHSDMSTMTPTHIHTHMLVYVCVC